MSFTSSIVWGVSREDHEIGRQTAHSIPTVAVVVEQLTTSNPLATASVSRNGVPKTFDGFTIKLRFEFGLRLAFRQPDDAREHPDNCDDGAGNGEELDHLATFFAA